MNIAGLLFIHRTVCCQHLRPGKKCFVRIQEGVDEVASPSRRCFHELDIVTSARLAARSANSSGGGASGRRPAGSETADACADAGVRSRHWPTWKSQYDVSISLSRSRPMSWRCILWPGSLRPASAAKCAQVPSCAAGRYNGVSLSSRGISTL